MSAGRRYFCVIGNSLEFPITQKGTFFLKFILKSRQISDALVT